ncbi:Site-specific DNA recombinase [Acetitomaculum ruminis DSM 5522]|uniref:Site-specific DNA recombinase n=1 Tax=Acetitomaculum ruminis DSM 5522 TaxID=1120918 RepID=A0A1I0YTJ1_9FIRM|nr:recombinase family protein [Acetitomaculum ruminis]SFB15433.1 Site-specific DNA recombinase [Acetitomaculum ruminis DSM 5522]
MVYGYARVSTRGQARDGNSPEHQKEELTSAGAIKIFCESFTGTEKHRPELDKLLSRLKKGDTVIVSKIDRIARNTKDGIEIIDTITDKGCRLHILNMGMFDNTPTGRLMKNIMLAFAQWERDQIIERTQSGREIAKLRSDYQNGRPKKIKDLVAFQKFLKM